ncbi:MAG: hypothetical protein JSW47_02070 [Phycisphaerales bacterium]|nr:MAG: hypothetical protein JSW47_02070 [Phycisphaerales bacterium]UCF13904.1 MAG: hypothetical protein JSW59_10865 [Phycisphaerales bacterium]
MKQNKSAWLNRFLIVAFLILTFFCWCPLLYGSYGPAKRILGIPSWAALAFVFGAVLFVLEWIYLFLTGKAMSDEELPDIVSELEAVDTDAPGAGKEDG